MSAAELIPAEGDAPSGFDFSGKLADASGGGVAAAEADYEQKFAAPLLALHREKSGRTTALLTARNYPAVRALFAAEFRPQPGAGPRDRVRRETRRARRLAGRPAGGAGDAV